MRVSVADLMPAALSDLSALVAIPSVFGSPDSALAASLVASLLSSAGVSSVSSVPVDDGSVAVIGHTPGPPGAPTVLLYSHYDVQPAGPLSSWESDPFVLTPRSGRLFGRGSADCKGNLVALLTALRALPKPWPVGIRVVCEGSEEASTGGLTRLALSSPSLFAADLMLIADTGNVALGVPTVTTSLRGTGSVLVTTSSLAGPTHSGMYGGAAPDALAALIATLASLRDEAGDTTIDGLVNDGVWDGAVYPSSRFVEDAGILSGVSVTGSGSIADTLWARSAATVLAIDAPSVEEATASIQGTASALVNLRVPPSVDAAVAQQLLIDHLVAHTPWGVSVTVTPRTLGQGFSARTEGPYFAALASAFSTAFGQPLVTTGQGGAIPLCNALATAHPDAEILLIGVEEPACHIHAPNESVDPAEIERTALGIALLLESFVG